MMDSQFLQNFQIQIPYSTFQIHSQQEQPIDIEKNMEALIHIQNDFNQSINRGELD